MGSFFPTIRQNSDHFFLPLNIIPPPFGHNKLTLMRSKRSQVQKFTVQGYKKLRHLLCIVNSTLCKAHYELLGQDRLELTNQRFRFSVNPEPLNPEPVNGYNAYLCILLFWHTSCYFNLKLKFTFNFTDKNNGASAIFEYSAILGSSMRN